MSIFNITENMWDEILAVQTEVYFDVVPEDIVVLKGKWMLSPECCFVYKTEGKISSYLLAHKWEGDTPPKLHERLPEDSSGNNLFLHDLAVSTHIKGQGVGRVMVEKLLGVARQQCVKKVYLISIQNSVPFWAKLGFIAAESQDVCASYGRGATLMSLVLNV